MLPLEGRGAGEEEGIEERGDPEEPQEPPGAEGCEPPEEEPEGRAGAGVMTGRGAGETRGMAGEADEAGAPGERGAEARAGSVSFTVARLPWGAGRGRAEPV